MLTNTFCHVPGIGRVTEQHLWAQGIHCWDDCLDVDLAPFLGNRVRMTEMHLEESQEALRRYDALFFTRSMPQTEHWRIFPEFRSRIGYIDIETTGIAINNHITTVAIYDGRTVRHYVHGENLRDLKDDIFNYDVLVSYNGKCFDIPFIENYFMIRLPQAQIDLRYVFSRLGIKGGLKSVERQLGIDRGELDGVDGYFAVLLWQEYERWRDPRALDTLLAYNIADTVNLERLLVQAYNMCIADTPFEIVRALPEPILEPENPFTPDLAIIEKVRQRIGGRRIVEM